MANKSLFSNFKNLLPRTNSINEAGGAAYKFSAKQALAQLAATGCFNGVFYANAQTQLDTLRSLIDEVDDNVFLAKLAVYSRERAFMKDMPAALVASLSTRDTALMHQVFDRVIDNGRVLRTLFQMVRSGQFGRNSLSSSLQRAFQRWLNEASVSKLLSASIGNDPSLRDVLRLARPTPRDNARRALFGWLTDKDVEKWAPATEADLPQDLKQLIKYRRITGEKDQAAVAADLNVRWDLLADAARGPKVWKAIARQMGPQALRMNLNTLLRHQVLEDREMVDYVAGRVADATEIRRSRQFPYQYLAAYLNASTELPHKIRDALHRAAEIACGNIPELPGPVVIGLDTSGSMNCPVTGYRGGGGTSAVRCVDVAALFAAAILRRNPDSVLVPFDTIAYDARLDPSDSILSLSKRLGQMGGGGTDCSIPLREANSRYRNRRFAGCVLISDNESWIRNGQAFGYGAYGSTGVMTEWQDFVKNQLRLQGGDITGPKLVCIDIQPYGTSQAPERSDILNIGGFSDAVFNVVSGFLSGDESRFVKEVEAVEL
ncbi:TROVE domain-containing protein [Rubinisphaera margarita]|uniref:TROVE domain-containing protein n=1 Tax=Rubinisphaera margarita TaxID=2909586 RepID=UPI001EE8C1D4|nr:TROVE domain-containing protein [Rubinisphaera margarita]MCG6156538.1 TROVE domain-containing protein [Rubinisphaera margarita]